jgi:biopolymer transport protein ExbB
MRKFPLVFCVLLGIPQSWIFPQSITETVAYSEQKVNEAREQLNSVRDAVFAEKVPLMEQWTELQSSVISLRREAESQDSSTNGLRQELERMESEAGDIEQSLAYINSRLVQARSEYESSLHLAERSKFEELLLSADPSNVSSPRSEADELEALLVVMESALTRLDQSLGGNVYEGKANVQDILETGDVLQIGPYAFFSSVEGIGGVLLENETLAAEMRILDDQVYQGISRIMNGGSAVLPFDPSMGDAYALTDATPGFIEHLKAGGIWMIPIFFFGILSLGIALQKYFEVRKVVVPEGALIDELVQVARSGGDENTFSQKLEGTSPVIRPIFKEGYLYRNYPESTREAAMHQEFISFRGRIEARLSLISVTAAVSPLLGLLGTVTGMIKTFHLISLYGSGDARALSSGISEALVTTEYGLIVAIPALLFHALLSRKSKGMIIRVAALIDKFNKTVSGA